MIVAVPYLQGNVNAHFGSTQAFLVAHTTDGKVEHTSIFELQGMQHDHAGIAGFLKEQGVEVILAGGMGAPMQQALKGAGFEVLCGVSGPALEAVDAFLQGEIEPSDVTCGHHHGSHHEAC
jgi:predicted Fe-Mo cluster-binding NifX family protein